MNFQELLSAIEKHYNEDVSEFAYDRGGEDILTEEIGSMKEVEQYGGEGQGDTWYSVKYFPKHDIYIKVSGFYASHDGTSFDSFEDDCAEVKLKQKTLTVYE